VSSFLRRALGYNVINGVQVALAVTFQILLLRSFGASSLTDAYFISLAFVSFVSTLASAMAEMLMQYYHELKLASPREAVRLYQAILNVTVVLGLVSTLLIPLFASPLVALLAPGFDTEARHTMTVVLAILGLGVTASAAMRVSATLLRAEMRFLPTYLLGLIPPGLNVATILVCGAVYGIAVVAAAIVVSTTVAFGIQQVVIVRRLGIGWAPGVWHPRLGELIRDSLVLRLGHQIWDLKDLVATNVLSVLPGGTVTLYVYGARIIAMVYALTSAASLEMLLSHVSSLAARRDFSAMRPFLWRNLVVFTSVFVAGVAAVAALLPELLRLVVGARLSAPERSMIHGVFLALIPFYVIVSLESSWVTLAIVMKQALRVALIGAAFIAIFWTLAHALRQDLGVYAVPAALAVAQLDNLAWYWRSGLRLLRRATCGTPCASAPGTA
jgi:putative peptidoglycan lipid II flippase